VAGQFNSKSTPARCAIERARGLNGQGPPPTWVNNRTYIYGAAFNGEPFENPFVIPDFNGAPACMSVPLQVRYPSSSVRIYQYDVSFSIDHTYVHDLTVELIAPDGAKAMLVNRTGYAGDHFINTRIVNALGGIGCGPNDTSSQCLRTTDGAQAPFSSVYRSSGDQLDGLRFKPASGEFQFKVCDNAGADVGAIRWVRMYLQPE
jgi:subtilisin-like proprotein convertase family protein